MKRYLFLIGLTLMLCACGSRHNVYNLEKEGIAYNYSEKVYFYYPRDWEVQPDTLKLSLDITSNSNKESFFFDSFEVTSSNSGEELMKLYITNLENMGIVIEKQEEGQLQNVYPCYFLSGYDSKDNTYFSEVTAFADGRQYIYSYIAEKRVYEKNIDHMKLYLASLVINEAQKAV